VCVGKHAVPIVPSIAKDDGSVEVLHSSQVKDFGPYKGKNVVVVGAGASGLDLLTNTLRVSASARLRACIVACKLVHVLRIYHMSE
jgi:cation diffusion facilitator CzcD-associated flavoprotein CzcO